MHQLQLTKDDVFFEIHQDPFSKEYQVTRNFYCHAKVVFRSQNLIAANNLLETYKTVTQAKEPKNWLMIEGE